jgi:uroporphyrinogen-III synthase
MTRPVIILRPEPGNRETEIRAQALGLETVSIPLFVVAPVDWEIPNPNDYDAVLMTSANAARHGGQGLQRFTRMHLFVVGEATEAVARAAGFATISTGSGDVSQLFGQSPPQRLLHFCGTEVTAFDHPDIWIDPRIVYQSRAIEPRADWSLQLARPSIALIHSARAGVRFSEIIKHCGGDQSSISLVAISAKAGDAAGIGWERVAVAANPRDEAMLDLARQIARTG